jgi:peroxiredoxin
MARGKSKSQRIRSSRRPPSERRAFWTNRSIAAVALAAVVVGGLAWALVTQSSDDPGAGDVVIGELAAQGRDLVTAAPNREPSPQFAVQTASYGDGSLFDLASSRGDIVILYFMAAWCVTCIPETEALDVLHDRYSSLGVRILIVDVDTTEDEGDLSGFRDKTGQGDHLWAMDTGNVIAQTFGVRFLDTTIIIDREGNVAFSDARPTEYETLAAVVEALL